MLKSSFICYMRTRATRPFTPCSSVGKPKLGTNGETRAARCENLCVAPLMANATKLSEERTQLPKPRMTFQIKDGAPEVSLKECDTDHKALKDYMEISETSDGVSIKIRLSTNITSKCHDHKKFQFVSRVSTTSNGIDQVLSGKSLAFEFLAKNPGKNLKRSAQVIDPLAA